MNPGTNWQQTPANLIELCRQQRDPREEPHGRCGDSSAPANGTNGFDERAQMANRVRDLAETREQKVQRIRAEINAGTYDVENRLSAVLDRLLDELPLTHMSEGVQQPRLV